MTELNPITMYFEDNKNIGPSVADFRRFIANFDPRPEFKHVVLACGTVIRGDIISKTPAGEMNNLYKELCDEMIADKRIKLSADEINSLYTILSANQSADIPAEVSAILTNQKIWLTQILNRPFGEYIMNLSPGETCEQSCEYGLGANKADMIRPTIIAIITPAANGYNISWPYGKPATYHW